MTEDEFDPVLAAMLIAVLTPIFAVARYYEWALELREKELTFLGHLVTLPALLLGFIGRVIWQSYKGSMQKVFSFKDYFWNIYESATPESWLVKEGDSK